MIWESLRVILEACDFSHGSFTIRMSGLNHNKKLHLFTCKNCGYKSNDDRIGAMNLYRMGINYLEDSQVPKIL